LGQWLPSKTFCSNARSVCIQLLHHRIVLVTSLRKSRNYGYQNITSQLPRPTLDNEVLKKRLFNKIFESHSEHPVDGRLKKQYQTTAMFVTTQLRPKLLMSYSKTKNIEVKILKSICIL
jgi:hypothetical protein